MESVQLTYFHQPNYWEHTTVDAHTVDEVFELVNRLYETVYRAMGEPVLLFFTNLRGERFGLGVGGELSIVVLVRNHDSFQYSIGDSSRVDNTVFLCPAWTEFPASYLIPRDLARAGLRAWLHGQDLSSIIQLTD